MGETARRNSVLTDDLAALVDGLWAVVEHPAGTVSALRRDVPTIEVEPDDSAVEARPNWSELRPPPPGMSGRPTWNRIAAATERSEPEAIAEAVWPLIVTRSTTSPPRASTCAAPRACSHHRPGHRRRRVPCLISVSTDRATSDELVLDQERLTPPKRLAFLHAEPSKHPYETEP